MSMSNKVSPVTANEQKLLTFQHRYEHCYSQLGIRYPARRLARCMMANAGGWSARSLAYYTASSLSSVRRGLARMQANGDAAREANGWELTESAKLIIVLIHRECIEIASGRQAGFSDELLHRMTNRYKYLKIQKNAATIDFSSAGIIDLMPHG